MAKILLADDSGHAQRMGAKILAAEGHEVATVSNGQAAVKMLKDFLPDLIVADVFMPGKSGYELCEFVKKDPQLSHIPVLLIVAPIEPYDASEGKRVKADGLVTKPLEKSNLVAEVQRLLASAKKPAAPAAKPPTPEPAAVEEPEPAAGESITRPITTPVKLEIPEEMSQQPIGLMGDLLEPAAAPPAEEGRVAELTPVEAPVLEAVPQEQPEEIQLEPLLPAMESAQTEIEPPLAAPESFLESRLQGSLNLPAVETAAESEMLVPTMPSPESSPAAGPSWTAEAVEVTEEDKKLFEPPPPDWQGLASMVQEEEGDAPFPLAAAAGAEAMAAAPPPKAPITSLSDAITMLAPTIAPLDYATVEQIVRETVEEMMPQIVGRIEQATGITFQKKR